MGRSGLAWVGERGPELVAMGAGSRVFPHNQSMGMAGGGGPIHTHVYLDRREIAEAVTEYSYRRGGSSSLLPG